MSFYGQTEAVSQLVRQHFERLPLAVRKIYADANVEERYALALFHLKQIPIPYEHCDRLGAILPAFLAIGISSTDKEYLDISDGSPYFFWASPGLILTPAGEQKARDMLKAEDPRIIVVPICDIWAGALELKSLLHGEREPFWIHDRYIDRHSLNLITNDFLEGSGRFMFSWKPTQSSLGENPNKFLSELKGLEKSYRWEFRSNPNGQIHDRFILTRDSVITMGHSVKNLGSATSVIMKCSKASYPDVYEKLREEFEIIWRDSQSSGDLKT